MEKIKVKKAELIKVLIDNRDKHNKIFLEAQAGYRKLAIEELDRMLEEARAGKRIRRVITLVEPVDQTKDYSRVILMMQMSVDEEVLLSESEFSMYILDEWHWKKQFSEEDD